MCEIVENYAKQCAKKAADEATKEAAMDNARSSDDRTSVIRGIFCFIRNFASIKQIRSKKRAFSCNTFFLVPAI